jgi:argininosuccinate synthase
MDANLLHISYEGKRAEHFSGFGGGRERKRKKETQLTLSPSLDLPFKKKTLKKTRKKHEKQKTGNALEDPWVEPSESMFTRSVSPETAPDKPTYIEIGFENGDPVSLNGAPMSPATILEALNKVSFFFPTLSFPLLFQKKLKTKKKNY